MKNKRIYNGLILLLMGFILAGTAAAQPVALTPTNPVLDYDLTYVDGNLKPGDSGILQVVISNTGLQPAEDVRVYIPGTADVSVDKKWEIGRIEAWGSKTMSTTVHVSDKAYIGLHTLQVRITYDGFDAEGGRENDQLSVWELPLRVYGSANFQVNVADKKFYKDITEALVFSGSIKDGARDVSATLSSTCASITGSAKSYMGDLSTGEEFELTYYVQPTELGVCPLSLLMEYSDVSGNDLTETLSVGIDVQRYSVDFKVTDVSYESMAPGTTVSLSLQVSNMGGAGADDVSVTLDVSSPFTVIKSSEKYIGDIKSRETKTIEFQVMVDAEADIKAYKLPLKIEYFDPAGVKQEVSKEVGVRVTGKPEIKVTLDEVDFFTTGSKGTVSINVINKGFADVRFLNLRLLPTDDYTVLSKDEAYIGNLDSDDTDSEEFMIQVKQVPAGKIPLMVKVTFKEKNSNVDHNESMKAELTILSKAEYAQKNPANGSTTLLITAIGALIGIVVLILVLWFIYKLLTSVTGYLDRKLFKRRR